jgi:hypothetical protein
VGSSTNFKGYWWLPANPEYQWFGNLRWRPGGSPKLKLHYRTVDEGLAIPPVRAESILGLDEGGTPISLLKLGIYEGVRPELLSQRKYIAGHFLRGIHVTSPNEFRAHRINLWAQYLSAWLREEGFVQENSFAIKYERPQNRSFEIASGVTIHICHDARSFARNQERTVSYKIFLAVERERAFSWRQASRYIEGLIALLHFACLKHVKPTRITFENLDHTLLVGRERIPKKIELFNGAIEAAQREKLHEWDFVFMFGDVEARFSELCRRWLQFYIDQREALTCYDATVHFSLPETLRLISLTQALEAYHQRSYSPKRDVKFKDRIIELCSTACAKIEGVVGNIDQFATAVTNSRDYYTHHHPSICSGGNIATGSKLVLMCYHLQVLFRLSVLKQFGLDADKFSVLLRELPQWIIEY